MIPENMLVAVLACLSSPADETGNAISERSAWAILSLISFNFSASLSSASSLFIPAGTKPLKLSMPAGLSSSFSGRGVHPVQ